MATYRHKTISRYRISGFEFKNGLLRIDDEERNEEFLRIMAQQPPRERAGITILNEAAMAEMERDLNHQRSRVVRGAQDSGTIKSGVKGSDGKAIANANLLGLAAQEGNGGGIDPAAHQAAIDKAVEDAKNQWEQDALKKRLAEMQSTGDSTDKSEPAPTAEELAAEAAKKDESEKLAAAEALKAKQTQTPGIAGLGLVKKPA